MEYRSDHGRPDPPTYCAVRTPNRLFVHYTSGEEELYDLDRDPWQLWNLARVPRRREELTALRRRSRAALPTEAPRIHLGLRLFRPLRLCALGEVGGTIQFHVRDAATADEDLRSPPRPGGGAVDPGSAVHVQQKGVTPVLGSGSRRIARFQDARGPSAGGIQLRRGDRTGRREELPPRLHRIDSPVRRHRSIPRRRLIAWVCPSSDR